MLSFIQIVTVVCAVVMSVVILIDSRRQFPPIANVPQPMPHKLDLKDHEQVNVHFNAYMQGSTLLSFESTMRELDAERRINQDTQESVPKFSISALVANGTKLKVKESDHFKMITLPFTQPEMHPDPENIKETMTDMLAKVNTLLREDENFDILENQIGSMKPDLLVCNPLPQDKIMAKYLGASPMQFTAYMPEPVVPMINYLPLQYSYGIIFLAPTEWIARLAPNHPIRKFMNMMAYSVGNALVNWRFVQEEGDLLPATHGQFDLSNAFIFGYGIEPINDVIQRPPGLATWNPANRFLSKVHPQSTFGQIEDQEILAHYEKYDKMILVAFGTTFLPPLEGLVNLAESFGQDPSIGVIISVKKPDYQEALKALNLKNILVMPFVPQKEILADPRTKLFCTHGGATSVFESIYYGVPMLVFPVDGDQKGYAAMMEEQGIGIYSNIGGKQDEILKQAHQVIDPKSSYKENTVKVSKMMDFEEARKGKGAVYWFEYVGRFGSSHLNNPTHKISMVSMYDIDIKLILSSLFLIVIQVVFMAIKSIFKK